MVRWLSETRHPFRTKGGMVTYRKKTKKLKRVHFFGRKLLAMSNDTTQKWNVISKPWYRSRLIIRTTILQWNPFSSKLERHIVKMARFQANVLNVKSGVPTEIARTTTTATTTTINHRCTRKTIARRRRLLIHAMIRYRILPICTAAMVWSLLQVLLEACHPILVVQSSGGFPRGAIVLVSGINHSRYNQYSTFGHNTSEPWSSLVVGGTLAFSPLSASFLSLHRLLWVYPDEWQELSSSTQLLLTKGDANFVDHRLWYGNGTPWLPMECIHGQVVGRLAVSTAGIGHLLIWIEQNVPLDLLSLIFSLGGVALALFSWRKSAMSHKNKNIIPVRASHHYRLLVWIYCDHITLALLLAMHKMKYLVTTIEIWKTGRCAIGRWVLLNRDHTAQLPMLGSCASMYPFPPYSLAEVDTFLSDGSQEINNGEKKEFSAEDCTRRSVHTVVDFSSSFLVLLRRLDEEGLSI